MLDCIEFRILQMLLLITSTARVSFDIVRTATSLSRALLDCQIERAHGIEIIHWISLRATINVLEVTRNNVI